MRWQEHGGDSFMYLKVANMMANLFHYSTFIQCTNSDFLIGRFVPRDPGL